MLWHLLFWQTCRWVTAVKLCTVIVTGHGDVCQKWQQIWRHSNWDIQLENPLIGQTDRADTKHEISRKRLKLRTKQRESNLLRFERWIEQHQYTGYFMKKNSRKTILNWLSRFGLIDLYLFFFCGLNFINNFKHQLLLVVRQLLKNDKNAIIYSTVKIQCTLDY